MSPYINESEIMIPEKIRNTISQRLHFIYGSRLTESHKSSVFNLLEKYKTEEHTVTEKWNEKDIVLITYSDSIKKKGEKTLQTLHRFIVKNLKKCISCVHILPFFPYSSDDGFSVIDYKKVDPALGDWKEIHELGHDTDLMFDLVVNHISQHSQWFQNFKKGIKPGKSFFITENPDTDLSDVVRPRTSPLLTAVETNEGIKHVWTTFSADQIDLDFSHPDLFIEMLDVLFFYIANGARIIRMDAIAFLWKEVGTSCLHLPQTHEMVKLFRDVAEYVDPRTIILTETNVPNKENLSYFGDNDETHMVYQFSLPPLLLHALYTGNSAYLMKWATTIPDLPPGNTFFNFTASHDGIGVRPLEGLLPRKEFDMILDAMQQQGGHISTKTNQDGSVSPYEMNISLIDAYKSDIDNRNDLQFERFICSQTIMMAMRGIPAPYIHSLLATPNYHEGVKETGRARTINRRKWDIDELMPVLNDDNNLQAKIFTELKKLLELRRQQPAFHPDAKQQILNFGDDFFAIKRESLSGNQQLFSISNMTHAEKHVSLKKLLRLHFSPGYDLIQNRNINGEDLKLIFRPYQTMWLVREF